MQYSFKELVDVPQLQELTDELYIASNIPSAIITMDGEILTGSGWQRICTDFHRQHPQIEKECIESDIKIRKKLDEGEPFAIYKCPRGMIDASAPVIIAGEHVANVFAGQVFFDPPVETTEQFFREQAQKFGFDEIEYIKAFREIPIFPKERFKAALSFLSNLAKIIAEMGLVRLRELEAMKALRESEDKYRNILENIEDGYYEVDIAGNFTFFNNSMCQILGYSADELMGMNNRKYMDGENAKKIFQAFHEVYETGTATKALDWELIKKDGSECFVETVVSLVTDSNNNKVGFRGVARDVSERKQAEAMLQKEKATLSMIFENSPNGITLINKKGKYLYVNPMFTKITGYTLQDVQVGKEWFQKAYPGPEYRNTIIDAWKEDSLQEGVGGDYCFKVTCKDGQVKDIEFRTTYLKYQSISVLTDVSYRKHAEEALRESEERYRQLFNNAPAGIYEVDFLKGKFITVNEVMCGYSGYTKEELLSMSPFDLLTENSKKRFSKRLEEIFAGEKMPRDVEYDIITKNGQELCVLLNSDFVYESGKLKGARVVVHDITKRKRLEEELRYAHRMEAVGTLAGGIAHQFNNALYTITGNIDLLEMDFPGDKNVTNYAKEMKASATRMTQLTAQLLAFARGGKHQTKIISVSDFVRETLLLVKYTIDSAIDVDTDLPCDILNVKADLTQIQMVLSAVLTNASEAMEDKGHIRVAHKKVAIAEDTTEDFPGLKPGNYACLTVTDDGKGMNEETRTRIFEPFFTTKLEGRGLGMAAAYGIVKNHDGWISVDSELDQGTTVKIYLPAVETLVKKDVKKSPRAQWVKGTGTILVIDDEESVMKVMRAILERMGYRVLEARNGQEAIDVVKTYDGDIELAMLDILMPGMSGETIYPLLMKARPDLKVLVFSGYSIDGPVQKILDAGAEDFIQKPFTIADLSAKLKKTLGGEQ